MKNNNFRFFLIFVSFLIIILISLASSSINKLVFFNRAAGNQLNIQIKLQGEYDKITNATFNTKVALYSQSGLVKEYSNQNLTRDNQSIFKLTIDTTGLNLNQMYAIFIKPDKYLGKLFCSPTLYSTNCKVPQITISSGIGNLDLTQDLFFSGDISPQDGKIAADDISKIMNQVGQVSTSYLTADINSDGMVQTVDYSLALYSLSKNSVDDSIPFTGTAVTPAPTTAGSIPTTTVKPTPTIASVNPTATTGPPSPTSTVSGGTCKATVNGKIYGKYSLINFCSPLINEIGYMCVTSANDCTVNNCIEQIIVAARAGINFCASSATLDESKSRPTLSCQMEFVPGPCISTPTPTISCSNDGPSC